MDVGDFRKATPGIMESWRARAPIGPAHCFIAVGFPSPGRAVAAKGTGVHWLKGDISWVQYVVIWRRVFTGANSFPSIKIT